MKTLVTAGTVYGKLDDNKLVGNRVRGIWAAKFADWLAAYHLDWEVTLLVADTQKREIDHMLVDPDAAPPPNLKVVTHKGYHHYRDLVMHTMDTHDSAVMAAAVVNWIPEKPIDGKMPTAGYKPGDVINIPFVLAPRVIEDIRKVYEYRTVIGCKMTIGETREHLIDAAYKTLLAARCNAVVANDMKLGLHTKLLVHQDRTTQEFELPGNRTFDEMREQAVREGRPVIVRSTKDFYESLRDIIKDERYHTRNEGQLTAAKASATATFDRFVARYRTRFSKRLPDGEFVFGALAVPYNGPGAHEDLRKEALISPREKGSKFDSRSAVVVTDVHFADRRVCTYGGKATLNAPLLIRHLMKYPEAYGVLHLHEHLEGRPTVPYFPPGTARDSNRPIPGPVYNIDGHGFIACLDANGEIWK